MKILLGFQKETKTSKDFPGLPKKPSEALQPHRILVIHQNSYLNLSNSYEFLGLPTLSLKKTQREAKLAPAQ